MNKVLPLLVVLALAAPAANANVLTDAAHKVVSVAKAVTRTVFVGPAEILSDLAKDAVVAAFNASDKVLAKVSDLAQ